jgi:hypothetical protein
MNYEAVPVIRLEIEGMKHSILQHLGVVGSELGKNLEGEIEKALDEAKKLYRSELTKLRDRIKWLESKENNEMVHNLTKPWKCNICGSKNSFTDMYEEDWDNDSWGDE